MEWGFEPPLRQYGFYPIQIQGFDSRYCIQVTHPTSNHFPYYRQLIQAVTHYNETVDGSVGWTVTLNENHRVQSLVLSIDHNRINDLVRILEKQAQKQAAHGDNPNPLRDLAESLPPNQQALRPSKL